MKTSQICQKYENFQAWLYDKCEKNPPWTNLELLEEEDAAEKGALGKKPSRFKLMFLENEVEVLCTPNKKKKKNAAKGLEK